MREKASLKEDIGQKEKPRSDTVFDWGEIGLD